MLGDPMILEYLMQQGLLTNEGDNLNRQAQMAQMLRGRTDTPDGKMVSGHYIAPNILQHAVGALGTMQADNRDRANLQGQQALGQRRQQSLADLVQQMRARQQPQPGTGGYRPLDMQDYGGGV